jgi:ABC-type multidrug transport system fused ATPase/permease subunit
MDYQFMGYQFTGTQILVAAFVLVILVIIAIAAFAERRKKKTTALRSRFGSEYARAVDDHGSAREAESKLSERQTRVAALSIRELGVTERERFVTEWHTVQARFLDHPRLAVTEADDLINALLEARGYPQSGFEQRAADLSVHYPRVMQEYRHAHSIAVRLGQVEASTEEQRTAMIEYRAIFDELLQSKAQIEVKPAA